VTLPTDFPELAPEQSQAGHAKPDHEQGILFYFSSPESPHTMAIILSFHYTDKFVLVT
jgi:hypothetical protein